MGSKLASGFPSSRYVVFRDDNASIEWNMQHIVILHLTHQWINRLIHTNSYTGAPFFSANASALLGADLSHIICEPGAAAVIKSYSPNLMVHPYMRQSNHLTKEDGEDEDSIVKRVEGMLDRLHVIVVGPGLGRDELMQRTAGRVVRAAREKGMGIVVDAVSFVLHFMFEADSKEPDALLLISADPSLVRSYKNAILTPNIVEFTRLCKALNVDASTDPATACERLAKALDGVTVIQKGKADNLSNGEKTEVCDIEGGLKRSGGQGDTLTGCLGTFLAWKKAYMERLWDHDNSLSEEELTAYAAFGASAITRTCSRLAFEEKGRHMQASDLQPQIQRAFQILFEDETGELEGKGAKL
ncbi:ATP-dependent (S)-NAD(P)H-hydrate dehydratase [Drechslerella dactyloides]|uniref:ATP-dependent (S)-NAD(P)H-hydrate dehydratase n=1 Tax=Drechslerella dactyloides TaxID=74499 RepID=A0AAD6IVW0_DREDA|nr:ATP-dependent (S)-NAD(P)H-hydrate dehydratase [Drechslerella dactyloides]